MDDVVSMGLVALTAILTSIAVVPIMSYILQRRYVRAVARGMASPAGVPGPAGARVVVRPTAMPDQSVAHPEIWRSTGAIPLLTEEPLAQTAGSITLVSRAVSASRHAAVSYVIAGTIFGTWSAATWAAAIMVSAFMIDPGMLRNPFTLILGILVIFVFALIFAPLFAWPLVPTLVALKLLDARTKKIVLILLAIGCAVLIVVAAPLLLLAGLPAAMIALFMAPAFRGVAWFITPVSLAAGLLFFGALSIPFASTPESRVNVSLGLGLAVLIAVGRTWLVVHRYARKQLSDDTLMISQWWFVQILMLMSIAMVFSVWAGACCFLAFVGFTVTLSRRLRRLQKRALGVPPVRLLMLRTFGHRRRSSQLLNNVASNWRWIGSIEVIASDDIAAATLEPHEFIDYLRGRLDSRFIRDMGTLERRLATLDLAPDSDGRYRINDLFCKDNIWRETLQRLVAESAAVLIDLRGFGVGNVGVAYEIEQLAIMCQLNRVVAIVDETTSVGLLQETVRRASRGREVNWTFEGELPRLRMIHVGRARKLSAAMIFDALCRCATQPQIRA